MEVRRNGSELILDTFISAAIELIRKSGEDHFLPVRGVSMRPFLYDGDMVLVTPFKDQLEPGEIIVYQKAGVLITHRVLHINNGDNKGITYITKGDNSALLDPPIKHGAVIGKVVAVRRDNREMRLDNRLWQITNSLIGSMMSALVKLYSAIIRPRTMKTGEELGFFSRVFRRGMLTISSLVIQLLSGLAGRWIMIEPREG